MASIVAKLAYATSQSSVGVVSTAGYKPRLGASFQTTISETYTEIMVLELLPSYQLAQIELPIFIRIVFGPTVQAAQNTVSPGISVSTSDDPLSPFLELFRTRVRLTPEGGVFSQVLVPKRSPSASRRYGEMSNTGGSPYYGQGQMESSRREYGYGGPDHFGSPRQMSQGSDGMENSLLHSPLQHYVQIRFYLRSPFPLNLNIMRVSLHGSVRDSPQRQQYGSMTIGGVDRPLRDQGLISYEMRSSPSLMSAPQQAVSPMNTQRSYPNRMEPDYRTEDNVRYQQRYATREEYDERYASQMGSGFMGTRPRTSTPRIPTDPRKEALFEFFHTPIATLANSYVDDPLFHPPRDPQPMSSLRQQQQQQYYQQQQISTSPAMGQPVQQQQSQLDLPEALSPPAPVINTQSPIPRSYSVQPQTQPVQEQQQSPSVIPNNTQNTVPQQPQQQQHPEGSVLPETQKTTQDSALRGTSMAPESSPQVPTTPTTNAIVPAGSPPGQISPGTPQQPPQFVPPVFMSNMPELFQQGILNWGLRERPLVKKLGKNEGKGKWIKFNWAVAPGSTMERIWISVRKSGGAAKPNPQLRPGQPQDGSGCGRGINIIPVQMLIAIVQDPLKKNEMRQVGLMVRTEVAPKPAKAGQPPTPQQPGRKAVIIGFANLPDAMEFQEILRAIVNVLGIQLIAGGGPPQMPGGPGMGMPQQGPMGSPLAAIPGANPMIPVGTRPGQGPIDNDPVVPL